MSISSTAWSSGNDDEPCGVNGERFCCDGVCCEPGSCCNEDGTCAFNGSSVCGGCLIDGVVCSDRTRNPVNPTCQICATNFNTTSWTTICCASLPCGHCP